MLCCSLCLNPQAIAAAALYAQDWPLLVLCPASLRLLWAEQLEQWLPCLDPRSIHLGKETPHSIHK